MSDRLPLNIAHFSDVAAPIVNGVTRSLDHLRVYQRILGHEVQLITPSLAGTKPGWSETERILRVPSWPLPTSTGYRTVMPFYSSRALQARTRDIQIFHAHSLFGMGHVARTLAWQRNQALIFTYHTRLDHYAHYAGLFAGFARQALASWTRFALRQTDCIVVPTHVVADDLRGLGICARIEIVPSGISLATFEQSRSLASFDLKRGLPDGSRVLLCVARLAVEKNLARLVSALAYCDRATHLFIVGAGPQQRQLGDLARGLNVADRVHFPGSVTPTTLPEYYAGADAFVFPSTSESQGLVLCEALAAGLPIVAVDSAVTREILAGTDAHIVPDDPAALARAVILALDPEQIVPQRRAPRVQSARRYEANVCARRLEQIYREILCTKQRRLRQGRPSQ